MQRDAAIARQRFQAVGHLAHDRHQIDRRVGPAMRIELDARQRQQIVDQARHAPSLFLHDRQEALARLGILARRSLQRLDEAEQRRERRAQFMAGIGDEVGAHFLDPAQRRQVVERHQHQIGPHRVGGALDRHDDGLEPAVERHALEIDDALLFALRRGAADGLDQFRHAQRKRHRLALPQRRRQRPRALVERQHPAVAIERDDGIGQAGDDGAQQIVAALGNRNRLAAALFLFAGADREHGRRRNDGETGRAHRNKASAPAKAKPANTIAAAAITRRPPRQRLSGQ